MQKYFVEARQLLALAIPVILAQVAQTAMGFVDTVMAGGYSATDIAAVAIGTSILAAGDPLRPRPSAGAPRWWRATQRIRAAGAYRAAGASGLLAGRLCLGADHGRAVETPDTSSAPCITSIRLLAEKAVGYLRAAVGRAGLSVLPGRS